MKNKVLILLALLVGMCPVMASAAIQPTLKYSNAGTFPLWTEESYYSAPAVCDIDGDGKDEIIFSNYTITVLDGATGKTEWKVNSGYDRNTPVKEFGLSNGHTWSDVEICDINNDGKMEIITGHGKGLISVLSSDGFFMPGWPQTPVVSSVRCITVADLENDGYSEIIVGYGVDGEGSVYVFNHDGTLRPGWPQLSPSNKSKTWLYGVFMDSIAAEDLNNDGIKEIIVPSDLSQISVFEPDGSLFMANSTVFGNRSWGMISLFEDYATEIKSENGGWGYPCNGSETREQLYKGEGGHAKAVVYDVDNNGTKEVIVSTIMCNRKYAPTYPPTEYMTIAILNSDRTRYRNDQKGYNWEIIPTDLGEPLYQNKINVSSGVFQSPVVSDLDGDGEVEILFNSYNGKVHCFGLNRTEPYAWPYSLTKRTSPMFEYASPVVCVDLDYDGKKEVIFTSFYDEYQNYAPMNGSLYILNYEGKLISKVTLPDSKEGKVHSNGGKASPVVKDIDGDGRYEIIVNTLTGAICVYDV
ncbi:MAG: FG-GAP repeat domain-containing protein [Clostridia bacterium]